MKSTLLSAVLLAAFVSTSALAQNANTASKEANKNYKEEFEGQAITPTKKTRTTGRLLTKPRKITREGLPKIETAILNSSERKMARKAFRIVKQDYRLAKKQESRKHVN